jgi:hypothetical protein
MEKSNISVIIPVVTIGNLLSAYKHNLPKEITEIFVGNKLYDKKYIIIKNFFKKILK